MPQHAGAPGSSPSPGGGSVGAEPDDESSQAAAPRRSRARHQGAEGRRARSGMSASLAPPSSTRRSAPLVEKGFPEQRKVALLGSVGLEGSQGASRALLGHAAADVGESR